MTYYPCGVCTIHVLESDEAIQCDGRCSLWYHRECLAMTVAAYLRLSSSQDDWVCHKCLQAGDIKHESEVTRNQSSDIDGAEMPKVNSKSKCRKLDRLKGNQRCVFCKTSEINEFKLGPVYKLGEIITHYYCLLLSSNMRQNGNDREGILGFLASDIVQEVKRGYRLHCSFCKVSGATLGCAVARCKVMFHLPCGIQNQTLNQFFGSFMSFCINHRPVQKIDENVLAEGCKDAVCVICHEEVTPRPVHDTLWAPCCKKAAFFHRNCVQMMALNAGYFFKCPLCNDIATFKDAMTKYGIFIPNQDASWETEPNAFSELLIRHDSCDLPNCLCPSGRQTNVSGTRWELRLCHLCGSQGVHVGCGKLGWKKKEFACAICSNEQNNQIVEPAVPRKKKSTLQRSILTAFDINQRDSLRRCSNTNEEYEELLSDRLIIQSRLTQARRSQSRPARKLRERGTASADRVESTGRSNTRPKKKRVQKKRMLSPTSSNDENLKKIKPCKVVVHQYVPLSQTDDDTDDEVEVITIVNQRILESKKSFVYSDDEESSDSDDCDDDHDDDSKSVARGVSHGEIIDLRNCPTPQVTGDYDTSSTPTADSITNTSVLDLDQELSSDGVKDGDIIDLRGSPTPTATGSPTTDELISTPSTSTSTTHEANNYKLILKVLGAVNEDKKGVLDGDVIDLRSSPIDLSVTPDMSRCWCKIGSPTCTICSSVISPSLTAVIPRQSQGTSPPPNHKHISSASCADPPIIDLEEEVITVE